MANNIRKEGEQDHPGGQQVAEQRERTDRDNQEAMKRMDESRPTPTQEENDLAKVGALDLTAPKEDHGAEDETEAFRKQQQKRLEATSAAPYQTRQMQPGQPQQPEQPPRQPQPPPQPQQPQPGQPQQSRPAPRAPNT